LFLNLVFLFCISNFTITTFISLFLPPLLSLLLHYNSFFPLTTTLPVPSHPLFPPVFTFFHSPPICHHTTPPSYTLTTCLLAYCTNSTQPQPPTIPETSTLHYNINTPKHTRATKPAAPIPLPPPTYPFSLSRF
jgi:hypothetical protein